MSVETFIDTNVLAYAFDDESPDKRAISQALIAEANFVTSAQVLGELYVTLTRKLTTKVPAEIAGQVVQELGVLTVIATTPALALSAISTSIQCQLSYWDALIVEAAVQGGCQTLLTEDLSDQAIIKGVRIVNPFRL